MNLRLLSDLFEGTKHRVVVAKDGEEAVAAALDESPDLVLMDLRMPRMDGREALAEIRTHERFHLLPVIAVTASSPGAEDAGAAVRFDGYLPKPFSRAQLYREIAQFIPPRQAESGGAAEATAPEGPTSPEDAAKWTRLVTILNEAEREDLPAILHSMAVPEVERFAGRLASLADEASCGPLARYAAALESDATSFSPDQIERTLTRFHGVAEAIRSAAAPVCR
jgi:CheY-like chemotaxis protein